MGWTIAFFSIWGALWWRGASQLKKQGRGWFMRNWIASTMAGFFVLIIWAVLLFAGAFNDESPVATSPVTPSTVAEHSIVKDEYRGSITRKVEVTLKKPLTEEQLRDIAYSIKAKAKHETERTFVGYRLKGKEAGTYWATTHYDPDLEVAVLGLSSEGYKTLFATDIQKMYPANIGAWLRDDYGSASHLLVAYERDGSYFIDSLFVDGGKSTRKMMGKSQPDGSLRLEETDNDFGEYYMIDRNGTLQGWNSDGLYLTVSSLKAQL